MKEIAIIFLTSLAVFTISAQLPEQLKVTPIGRVLVDGAFYTPDGDGLTSGVAVPDVRLGAKFAFLQWSGKIDVSYSYTYISDSPTYGDSHANIVQARIQFKF